ncbi:glycerophosphodiester phosphodiesterase [Treponema primitia]|uniref:glycerophosphodiester phosphodiesterase n=1 Tax=Treponema primitia TaxID=88058 RepID=UPI0002555066|nr:glycerophosphodiester phosphodiesterase family protein [Treponema primitia]
MSARRRVPLLPERPRPLVFAHRGCSSLAPENTMVSFRKARELGAPGLELDVHVCGGASAFGELVVAHDDTFERTAPPEHNGDGRDIEELTLAEIRRIDVGSFFDPAFSGEHPPLLEEVLEEFCPDMYIDIELKSRRTRNDLLPGLVAAKLKSLGDRVKGAVTLSSFNPFCLAAFKRLCPQFPAALIWSANFEVPFVLRYGLGRFFAPCDYVKPVHTQIKPLSYFQMAKLEGLPIVPWTIDDPTLAGHLLNLGCQGIITNRPQDMKDLLP